MSVLFRRNKWVDYDIIDSALEEETDYVRRAVKNMITALLCVGPRRGGPSSMDFLADSLFLSASRLSAAPLRAAKSLRYLSWNDETSTLRCTNRGYYLKEDVSFWNQEEFNRILDDVDRRARAQERETMRVLEWEEYELEEDELDSSDSDEKETVPNGTELEQDLCHRKRLLEEEDSAGESLYDVMEYYNKRFKKLIEDSSNMKKVFGDLEFSEEDIQAYEKETHDELDTTLLRLSEVVEKVIKRPLSKIRSQCPVCNENVAEPYALQCGHFMCKTCLDSPLFKKRQSRNKVVVSCPYCRGDQTFAKAICL